MMSKERYPPFSLWRIPFSFSSSLLLNAKKAPAHHISVKGRGLLLLDSNSVWGDGTTISFYRVSVPYQIFNSPRMLVIRTAGVLLHESCGSYGCGRRNLTLSVKNQPEERPRLQHRLLQCQNLPRRSR